MKKKILFSFLIILMVIVLVGCGKKEDKEPIVTPTSTPTPAPTPIEGNTRVGYLRFYAPSDYTYRADLRGLAYGENEKKVYIKGDYENNVTGVIYLISALEFSNKDVKEYIDSVNTKLTDNDVKFSLQTNSKNQEVYVRENYVINGMVNYLGDPYSVFMDQETSTAFNEKVNKLFNDASVLGYNKYDLSTRFLEIDFSK